MEDDAESALREPAFRSHKRRKVLRKRSNDSLERAGGAPPPNEDHIEPEQSGPIERDTPSTRPGSNLSQVRKPKKHGIAFSSTETARARQHGGEESSMLVPFQPAPSVIPEADRFIRPTGRAVMAEDKHMSAYIDSKLAELGSAKATSGQTTPTQQQVGLQSDESSGHTLTATGLSNEAQIAASKGSAKPSRSSAVLPTKSSTNPPPRRPRQPAARPESDIARDNLIDQILRESHVPIYDTQSPTRTTTDEGQGEVDNDAAAAAAFKADFLASMEEKKLLRRPPPSAVAGQTGPKLGGSRSARERMRVVEEQAKGKTGGVQK